MSTAMRRGFVAAAITLALLPAACGDGAEQDGLSDLAMEGQRIANQAGCSACHGTDGRNGGVGPGWVGLAGATVTREDGSQLVADTAYLRRAIVDPTADVRAGFTVQMPHVELSDSEVTALVAYIEELE